METYMQVYIIATTIMFLVFSLVWSKATWLNVLIKATLLAGFVSGTILSLESLGYIVKI